VACYRLEMMRNTLEFQAVSAISSQSGRTRQVLPTGWRLGFKLSGNCDPAKSITALLFSLSLAINFGCLFAFVCTLDVRVRSGSEMLDSRGPSIRLAGVARGASDASRDRAARDWFQAGATSKGRIS
jgi:hypothetical protein